MVLSIIYALNRSEGALSQDRVWCSNGILLASSFHTAAFSLLTALVIYSAKSLVRCVFVADGRVRCGHGSHSDNKTTVLTGLHAS